MSVLVLFDCADCGYGPFEVEGNEDATIPNPPCSIHHDDAEGRWLGSCPRCGAELPLFKRPRRKVMA